MSSENSDLHRLKPAQNSLTWTRPRRLVVAWSVLTQNTSNSLLAMARPCACFLLMIIYKTTPPHTKPAMKQSSEQITAVMATATPVPSPAV